LPPGPPTVPQPLGHDPARQTTTTVEGKRRPGHKPPLLVPLPPECDRWSRKTDRCRRRKFAPAASPARARRDKAGHGWGCLQWTLPVCLGAAWRAAGRRRRRSFARGRAPPPARGR
jgi:hypothetical protein